MNKTQFLDRCKEIFTTGRFQDQLVWQLNEKYGIKIDQKLQEIVDTKITMDFSWLQKKEVQDSGFTLAQEHLFSLGILEWGKTNQDPEFELSYDQKQYNIIKNPLSELNGYPGSLRSVKGQLPTIKAEPFLLVPIELAIKIKVLGYLP